MPVTSFSPMKVVSAAGLNAQNLIAAPTLVGLIVFGNSATAARYVKLYDSATPPNVGVDVPVQTYTAAGDVTGTSGTSTPVPIPAPGLRFLNGVALAITGGAADTDTTAVGLNEVTVNLGTTPNYD